MHVQLLACFESIELIQLTLKYVYPWPKAFASLVALLQSSYYREVVCNAAARITTLSISV